MRRQVVRLLLAVPVTGCLLEPSPHTCSSPWGLPTALAGVNTMSDEDAPWLAVDRKTLVFASNRGGSPSVYQATRTGPNAPFGAAIELPELVAKDPSDMYSDPITDDPEPYLTEDLMTAWVGRRIQYRDRDVARSTRASPVAPFAPPSPASLDTGVNSSNNDVDPSFSPDLGTVYFASDRTGHFELYAATAASPGLDFSMAVAIPGTQSTGNQRAPAISSDGNMLLYQTDQLGGRTIFEADRTGPGPGDFGTGVPFPPTSAMQAGAPYLLADGSALVFSADRADGNGRDLYLIEHCP